MSSRPVRAHYHACPECYEHWKCNLDCTIEPDLQDGDREFGSHCTCPVCDPNHPKYDQAWFDRYNGFLGV